MNRTARWLTVVAAVLVLAPMILMAAVFSIVSGDEQAVQAACDALAATGSGPGAPTTPVGVAGAGMFAAPLLLESGRSYRVGATEYGGPSDPGSSQWGSSGAYLPSEPDTFAELSVLDRNPANDGTFTFADANALNNLPYNTALRVSTGAAQKVLYKRDVGYGQGPGQAIPYRIDVWWQSAGPLGVSKDPVAIELAPATGSAGTLGELPSPGGGDPDPCPAGTTVGLTLTTGPQARILLDGSAAAPASAPRAVKLAVWAANEIHTEPYSIGPGAVHYGPLSGMWPAYDCSGSVSYVLYKAGLHGVNADVSGTLEGWGDPGPGRWITVYANSTHTWVVIAGLAFDTADFGGPNIPAGSGPRWRQNPTGNLQDGLSYVVRHPPGL